MARVEPPGGGINRTMSYRAQLPDLAYWTGRIPCQMACPVLTDCGRYVQLIAEGRYREAYLTARSPNPLASVCGRICAAPCESKCRRGNFDAPVAIRALKRFVTERYGVESREPDVFRELLAGADEPGNKWRWHLPPLAGELEGAGGGRRAAVIGAGPAGLACAHDLGAQRARDLRVPGSDLDGIVRAIDYLININNGYRVPRADRVLVVGGGFVAFDAARMALRAAAEVTLASLESYDEMPVMRTEQGKEEFEQAIEEGIRFLPQRGVERFEGEGRVARIHLIGVSRTYDADGRFNPVYDPAIHETRDADLVILAIGQQPELGFLRPEDGVV